jgi:hypothetical protein
MPRRTAGPAPPADSTPILGTSSRVASWSTAREASPTPHASPAARKPPNGGFSFSAWLHSRSAETVAPRPGSAYIPAMSPGFVPLCIPTRAARPPTAPDWIHEIKHDGYRLLTQPAATIGPHDRRYVYVDDSAKVDSARFGIEHRDLPFILRTTAITRRRPFSSSKNGRILTPSAWAMCHSVTTVRLRWPSSSSTARTPRGLPLGRPQAAPGAARREM